MNNVTFIEIETIGGVQTHAVIDNGDGTITSMPKAVWNELEAAKENGTISQDNV